MPWIAWLVPVGIGLWLHRAHGVFASYLPLPCAIACGLLYILLAKRSSPAAALRRG